jgi:hypothetical protein
VIRCKQFGSLEKRPVSNNSREFWWRQHTIEGEGQQPESTLHAKHLVDDGVLGGDPADPCKVTQGRKDEVGEPIPAERRKESEDEEVITRDLAID